MQQVEAAAKEYLKLRSRMRRFLGAAAAIIGSATLSTGTLRNLVYDVLNNPGVPEQLHISNASELIKNDTLFPAVLVTAYGAYFTALLAAIYLPAHGSLTEVGEALAERMTEEFEKQGPRTRRWSKRNEEHHAIRAYLGLEDNAYKTLQEDIAVLAPLVASLSSLILAKNG